MADMGNSMVSSGSTQEDSQPSWRVVALLAGACGVVAVSTVAMPLSFAMPLLVAGWLLGLGGLIFWDRTLTLVIPHVLAGVLLIAGARAHAVAWSDAWPLTAAHLLTGTIVTGAAIFATAPRLVMVAYLLPLIPCGMTAAYAWDHVLRHDWSSPIAATTALMATQAIGIVIAFRYAPLRALAVAMVLISFLIANQAQWHDQQRSLLHLRAAFERASAGVLEQEGGRPVFSATDACRWGDGAAPVRVSWVVDLHRPVEEISAQAAALLTLAPLVQQRQVSVSILLQDHEDTGLVGLADLGLFTWKAHGWLTVAKQAHGAGSATLTALLVEQLQAEGQASPLVTCAANIKQLAALRQAAAFHTTEWGLPRSSFLRVQRGDLILHQAVEVIDASHLASILGAPGVLP